MKHAVCMGTQTPNSVSVAVTGSWETSQKIEFENRFLSILTLNVKQILDIALTAFVLSGAEGPVFLAQTRIMLYWPV